VLTGVGTFFARAFVPGEALMIQGWRGVGPVSHAFTIALLYLGSAAVAHRGAGTPGAVAPLGAVGSGIARLIP
jgi:hypothetical protein